MFAYVYHNIDGCEDIEELDIVAADSGKMWRV